MDTQRMKHCIQGAKPRSPHVQRVGGAVHKVYEVWGAASQGAESPEGADPKDARNLKVCNRILLRGFR